MIVSMTVFMVILCAPLTAKAPWQTFLKDVFKKQIYSYNNILLPCNSHLISNDVSGHQILSQLREVNLLDYPLCRALFACAFGLLATDYDKLSEENNSVICSHCTF